MANRKKPIIVPETPYLPNIREQNPAPVPTSSGQQGISSKKTLTNIIMRTFQQVLPSNYVSQINGPFYTLQFQAAAEQLADFQLALEEIGLESDVDFARPEFIWQMIGTLVFPDIEETPTGVPEVDGDLTYREFLRRMIVLLLKGATKEAVQEGLGLLTEAVVEVIAKVDSSDRDISAWGFAEQHEFEINVLCQTVFTDPETGELIEGALGTGFPIEPFKLLRNNLRILRALRPAQSLFEYRHLFLDAFGDLFVAEPLIELEPWYYEDYRKFCCGLKEITSDAGETLTDRRLFSDVTRDFSPVPAGATLEILSGPNSSPNNGGENTGNFGKYRVLGIQRLLSTEDNDSDGNPIPRTYTTSPSGLSGSCTIDPSFEGTFVDPSQDFSLAVEGEILTLTEGPNAGSYRLETLLGNNGGPVGMVPAGAAVTQVRVTPSILQVCGFMLQSVSNQSYTLSLQRLGIRTPYTVLAEDASSQFYI